MAIVDMLALYCTLHLSRSLDGHCLAIRDTTPYKLTTGFQMDFRVQNIPTLVDGTLALPELPTFLTTMKEGKSCRYE